MWWLWVATSWARDIEVLASDDLSRICAELEGESETEPIRIVIEQGLAPGDPKSGCVLEQVQDVTLESAGSST